MGSSRLARGVVFEAIGDGTLLWKSKVIHEAREIDQVRLSVFSVEQLQLCVRAASKSECDQEMSNALEQSEGALPDKDAEGLKDGDGIDQLPIPSAGCLWFSAQVSGKGASRLPVGTPLAILSPRLLEGETAPLPPSMRGGEEDESDDKSKKDKKKKKDEEEGTKTRGGILTAAPGRHHPWCNYAAGLRALPIVTYAPQEDPSGSSGPSSGAGGESKVDEGDEAAVVGDAGATHSGEEDGSDDGEQAGASGGTLRVNYLDPATGLVVPRDVPVRVLSSISTLFGRKLEDDESQREAAAGTCGQLAVLSARHCLQAVVDSVSKAAEQARAVAAAAAQASSDGPPSMLPPPSLLRQATASDARVEVSEEAAVGMAGGPERLLSLLKLAAANDQSFREQAAHEDEEEGTGQPGG